MTPAMPSTRAVNTIVPTGWLNPALHTPTSWSSCLLTWAWISATYAPTSDVGPTNWTARLNKCIWEPHSLGELDDFGLRSPTLPPGSVFTIAHACHPVE
jgi:hypothetical protein